MKRTVLIFGILATLAFGQVANATTYDDTNKNWATWTATNNNEADPLGAPDIVSTSVALSAGRLDNITFNLISHNFDVKSGDLFIDSESDQRWDYLVRALGTSLNSSNTLGLFSVDVGIHDADAYKMSYYYNDILVADPATYRSGIPVGLLTTPTSFLGNVGYTANSAEISFDFTSLANSLYFDSEFIIGYAVTCGNDVIYQEVPVPEPGTMVLFGVGLLGLVVYSKRKMSKSA